MKLALISGGSKGMGKAFVDIYEAAGYHVIEFSRTGTSTYSMSTDFSDPKKTIGMFESLFSKLSTYNLTELIAISNAGVLTPIGPLANSIPEDWVDNLNVNLTSAIIFMGLFLKYFKTTPCRKVLVNISSEATKKGYFGWSLYCAAKAGLENFIHSVDLEQTHEPFPIRAITVTSGIIDTAMQASISSSNEAQFPTLKRFIDYKETGTLRSPEAVAQTIKHITENLKVDVFQYNIEDYDD